MIYILLESICAIPITGLIIKMTRDLSNLTWVTQRSKDCIRAKVEDVGNLRIRGLGVGVRGRARPFVVTIEERGLGRLPRLSLLMLL